MMICPLSQEIGADIQRKSGLPTLAIIKKDGTVLTLEGEKAVREKGPAALKQWAKDS